MKGIEQNKYAEQAITSCPTHLDAGTNILGKQGHIFWKIWQLSFTKILEVLQKTYKTVKKFGQKGIKTP